jgi:hypothetical protein
LATLRIHFIFQLTKVSREIQRVVEELFKRSLAGVENKEKNLWKSLNEVEENVN